MTLKIWLDAINDEIYILQEQKQNYQETGYARGLFKKPTKLGDSLYQLQINSSIKNI